MAVLALQSFSGPTVCDVVSAERIVLRNSRGKARMVLDAYSSRQPTLTFNDAKGRASMRLQVADDGSPDLSVFKQGKQAPATFRLDGSRLGLTELLARPKQTKSDDPGKAQGID